jgi:hypothetical protein
MSPAVRNVEPPLYSAKLGVRCAVCRRKSLHEGCLRSLICQQITAFIDRTIDSLPRVRVSRRAYDAMRARDDAGE